MRVEQKITEEFEEFSAIFFTKQLLSIHENIDPCLGALEELEVDTVRLDVERVLGVEAEESSLQQRRSLSERAEEGRHPLEARGNVWP